MTGHAVRVLDFDTELYNSLPNVIDAELRLKEAGDHEIAFGAMAREVAAHDCLDLFGLTLLHRHHHVPSGSRMEEDMEEGSNVLRMRVEVRPSLDAVPISWKVQVTKSGHSLVPLEFSRRPFAVELAARAEAHAAFKEKLCGMIVEAGLSDVVGISLLRFREIQVPGHMLVEVEDGDGTANVVRAVPQRDADEIAMVETNWHFFLDHEAGTRPTAGCNPDVICVRGSDGRHYREPRHWTFGPS